MEAAPLFVAVPCCGYLPSSPGLQAPPSHTHPQSLVVMGPTSPTYASCRLLPSSLKLSPISTSPLPSGQLQHALPPSLEHKVLQEPQYWGYPSCQGPHRDPIFTWHPNHNNNLGFSGFHTPQSLPEYYTAYKEVFYLTELLPTPSLRSYPNSAKATPLGGSSLSSTLGIAPSLLTTQDQESASRDQNAQTTTDHRFRLPLPRPPPVLNHRTAFPFCPAHHCCDAPPSS